MIRTSVRFAAAVLALALSAGAFAAAPKFQMPFPCKQVWHGNTRENHSPKLAVDLSRANGEGDKVVAAAKGTVSKVRSRGSAPVAATSVAFTGAPSSSGREGESSDRYWVASASDAVGIPIFQFMERSACSSS